MGAPITTPLYDLAEDHPGEIKEKVKELILESINSGEPIPLFYEIEVEGHSFYLYPEDELSYREYTELLENIDEETATDN